METNGERRKAVDIDGLRQLVASDEVARHAMEVLSQRQRRRTELVVEALAKDIVADRNTVYAFFKRIESLGCGRTVMGRGSKRTRFVWWYSMASVAKVALGQSDTLEPMNGAFDDETEGGEAATVSGSPPLAGGGSAVSISAVGSPGTRMVNYPFPIRPGLLATLTLPEDLSDDEAGRLAGFIKALGKPQAGDKPGM